MSEQAAHQILHPGSNCWRIENASRIGVAIDGETYFRAVREALLKAKKRVLILGWDIHSELKLVRDEEDDNFPRELGALLEFVASERGIDVYVLCWDFAMIYMLEREYFPLYTMNWKTHDRLRFQLDAKHPSGGSQHQKLVVIDDQVAFCGGIDLSQWRWDSSQHHVHDERRVDPSGKPYPPFHDLQMVVDGEAAAALGELAEKRWQRATGEEMPKLAESASSDPWPASLPPILVNTAIAIARTQPAYGDQEKVREVEELYVDSIKVASRYIYIENQYLTSHSIVTALEKRLREKHAPEVVLVLPLRTGGWLEQTVMDVVRSRAVKRLRAADAGDCLRLYYPQLTADGEKATMVHAKLMIVDDQLLRIGSSNLSNRSMGLDSECDLAVAGAPGSDTEQAIRGILAELLAQHLGKSTAEVAKSLQRETSLIATVENLRTGEQTLQTLNAEVDPATDKLVPEGTLLDSEEPMDSEHFVAHFVPEEYRPHSARRVLLAALTLAILLGLAAAWRWTPLGDMLNLEDLFRQAQSLESHAATPVVVILLFAAAGSLAVPLTLLVIACVLSFGPFAGFIYSLIGAQLSAVLSYFMGHCLGRKLVRRYAGKTLNSISKRLSRRGVLAIVTLRVVPVAPFAVINLVAGASHISLRDFAVGTMLGLLPGITAIGLFADGVSRALTSPDLNSFAWLAGLLLVLVVAGYLLRKLLITSSGSAGEIADN